jgi:hypothetical protein
MRRTYLVGDVFERMRDIRNGSISLVACSPPFIALRSYLPADHADKGKEIGSEPTPAEFLQTLLELTTQWGDLLAPWGSIAIELGDTYSGSGGAGGDYSAGGLRDGQPLADGSGRRQRAADVAAGILAPLKRPGPKDRDSINGWPQAKSLALIPQAYALSLAYGSTCSPGNHRRPAIGCAERDRVAPPKPRSRRSRRQGAPVYLVHLCRHPQPSPLVRPHRSPQGRGERQGHQLARQQRDEAGRSADVTRRRQVRQPHAVGAWWSPTVGLLVRRARRLDRPDLTIEPRALRHVAAEAGRTADPDDVPARGVPHMRRATAADRSHDQLGRLGTSDRSL